MTIRAPYPIMPGRLHDLEPAVTPGDDSEFWDADADIYNAIRAAQLAAEGAALRASARAAVMHRVALALLGVSLFLAIAMLLVPQLRPWSGEAVWVLLLGLAAYVAVVAIVYWMRPRPVAPELSQLRHIRNNIATLLERQRLRRVRQDQVLIRTLTDAIRYLDEQVIPAL